MKKLLSAAVCAAALVLFMAIPAFANDGTTTMYTVTQVVMYSEPSYTSTPIQVIPQGMDIICYQKQQNGFDHCFYGSSQGWIASQLLSKVRNGNEGGGQDNSLNGTYNSTMHTSEGVNLRSGPGLKYSVIALLDGNAPIFVYNVRDGWAEVDYGMTHGYVSTDYVAELNHKTPVTPVGPSVGPVVSGTTVYNGMDFKNVYNYNDYLALNPDVAAVYNGNPAGALSHFVTCGMKEGRQASYSWKLSDYKAMHPDYVALFGNNNVAYYKIACGIPLNVN